MPPETEAHVPVDVPVDVEVLGIGVLALVVPGRAGDEDYPHVRRDDRAVQLDLAQRPAALVVRRRVPAQHLLDRIRDQGGVRDQLAPLVGVPAQRDDAVGDELGHGLVAGEGQLHEARGQLVVTERARRAFGVLYLGVHQHRDDVIAGVAAPLPDQLG